MFADLSNNARGINVVKDDSIIGQKAAVEVLKETVSQDGASNPPLQRPAQRPLSVSGIKGFFNFTTGQQSQAAKKTQPDVVNSLNPQPQLRRAITKKATTVFRESEPDSQTSSFEGKPAFPNSSGDEVKLQKENTSENIRKPEAVVKSEAGTLVTQPTSKGGALTTAASDDIRANGTTLHELSYAELVYSAENVFPGIPPLGPAMPTLIQPHPIRPIDKPSGQPKVERRSGSSVVAVYPTVAEQWEDDHYVENDADYTTARSLKSRGECTTNPTTIVLAPKMTATAEKELEEATRFVQQSQEATELEEDEAWDTSMVAEYSEEIFSYMRNLEEQMRPNPHYMDNQSEVQWSMRSVLMDWLVQVHHRFSLLPETLFLCVNYIDRFLSCKVVSLGKLQLVGATAIFVAAKYEEINCPSVQEIVYMVDGGYTVDEILKAERFMLSMLQFELGWPGPMSFLRRISKADDYDLESRTLAKYFMEITIMDERFVGCIPSYTAAGAHCLARLMLDKGTWVSSTFAWLYGRTLTFVPSRKSMFTIQDTRIANYDRCC